MTGPYESVIGNVKEDVLKRFLTGLPQRLDVAAGDARLCGAVLEIDDSTGRARTLERITLKDNRL